MRVPRSGMVAGLLDGNDDPPKLIAAIGGLAVDDDEHTSAAIAHRRSQGGGVGRHLGSSVRGLAAGRGWT